MAKRSRRKQQHLKRQEHSASTTLPPLFFKIGTFLLVSTFLFGGIYSHPSYKWAVDALVVNSIKAQTRIFSKGCCYKAFS